MIMAQWHSETGMGNKGKLVKFRLRLYLLAK
jgi:hypothetical protein